MSIGFSIIVPVYNVECYLRECIESVLAQTLENWEMILVDDGSQDRSARICDTYAQRHDRIKVFHKVNEGLSEARNFGMKQATGDWILFLDGDDAFVPEALESFQPFMHENIDLIMGRFFWWNEEGEKAEKWNINCLDLECSAAHAMGAIMQKMDDCVWSAGRSIYKREFLTKNRLCFKKGVLAEDMEWFPAVVLSANQMQVNATPFYRYRQQRKGSITTAIKLQLPIDVCRHAFEWQTKLLHADVDELFYEQITIAHLKMAIWYLPFIRTRSKAEVKKYAAELKKLYPFSKACKAPITRLHYKIFCAFGSRITGWLVWRLRSIQERLPLLEILKKANKST